MTQKKAEANNVPMQGQGVYKSRSGLQGESLRKAMPMLQVATKAVSENARSPDHDLLRVVDYGAAHGNNSLVPLETILSETNRTHVLFELNDRPENDFTTTAATLNEWQQNRDESVFPQTLFVGMIPRSFYQRVVPTRSVDLAYCFAAIHFFENVPQLPDGHFEPDNMPDTLGIMRAQADIDLRKFLKLRAQEVVSGGQLLLSICATGFGEPDYFTSGPGECIRLAMLDMCADGSLSHKALNAYIIPCYFRTLDDVSGTLGSPDMEGLWTTVDTHHDQVMHPGWHDLESQKREGVYREEHSHLYATAMVDWYTAVSAGFFLRAVKEGGPSGITDEEAFALLDDMKRRASRIFSAKFKDSPVYGSFIYLLLRRQGD